MITVSRQPLFPDSTKEAVDLAEMMDGGGHSKQRRENFAKTAQSKFFLQSSICTFILYYKQIRSKGPSINDVASLEGGRGAKLTIWGDMRGVGGKKNHNLSILN